MNEIIGKINSIETFGSVDGPGIRFVVFMQGCNMRCKYCHNPETWDKDGGENITPKELLDKAIRYKNYWGDEGGITVSGGEPLLQLDFLIEFFKLAKSENINTCIDTAGEPYNKNDDAFIFKINELIKYTDLFLLDIKEIDNSKHKSLTGKDNTNILDFARYLSNNNKNMWIRYVLTPKVTDDKNDLIKLKDFIKGLKTVDKIEVLPYHTIGIFKWEKLNIDYPLKDIDTPSEDEISKAKEILIG